MVEREPCYVKELVLVCVCVVGRTAATYNHQRLASSRNMNVCIAADFDHKHVEDLRFFS